MPLVSVIVPNYNHAPYLRQRLDSIFNQTFQDFEVIILDDCSTDNSKEIIEEYRNRPQVSHVVYNETNSGSPFKQWAKGFDLAQGEYIWIAESDDWAELNFLNELYAIISKHNDAVLIYSALKIEFPDKTKILSTYPENININGITFIKSKMMGSNSIYNASCVLFRRDVIRNISSQYQNFRGCGDWLFWIDLCEQGNVIFFKEALCHFRQHSTNTTTENTISGNFLLEIYEIYKQSLNRGFLTFFHRQEVATMCLTQSRKGNSDLHKKAEVLWKKEVKHPFLSKIFVQGCIIFWNIKNVFVRPTKV